ncbi:orotidine-5'-phosphate decarboxylase [Neisseriaceae bacterium ESL0693]|nr:orotidine-5'-phosphate decarboxylase [Neisseriaceae bacterium ESL0693]
MNPLMLDAEPLFNQTKPVIVALDFDDAETTLQFVRRLNPDLCQLKIGKELFTASGRRLAEQLINQGYRLFLDLKYHDIPNTVASACKVAAQMGVWMVDMHASGGQRMMEAAAEAISQFHQRPLLIGVTVLTSMTEQDLADIFGASVSVPQQVMRLASLAHQSGLDGVVCSAQEAVMLRQHLPQDFLLVTPGIRLNIASNHDDQRRIMTPKAALAAGSSYLVMGRPITQAEDPITLLNQINRGEI